MSLLLLLQTAGAAPPPPTSRPHVPVTTIAGGFAPIKTGTFDLSEITNGRNTLTFDVVIRAGSARPAIDADVVTTVDGTRIFGGTIDRTAERRLGNRHLQIRVDCNDFNALADRRYIKTTLAAGTMKSQLITLVSYLTPLGITLDPGQVNGPTLGAMTYDYKQATEILNDLTKRSDGYVWNIDYAKQLSMYSPGTLVAPFNIVDGNQRALDDEDIQVEQHPRSSYANRIILRYGSSSIEEKVDPFTGNGAQTAFPLTYTPAPRADPYAAFVGYVSHNGANETLGSGANVYWSFDAATNTIIRYAAPPNGAPISSTYAVQFPQTVTADDAAGQATYGVLEKLVEYPDVFDKATAQTFANAELAAALERLTTVRYATRGLGLIPGQTQTITVASRNINASYLITDVQSRDDPDGQLRRTVTAVQGTTLRPTWGGYWKGLGGSGGSSSPVFTGTPGGGASAVTWSRPAYFLGGSGVEFVQSPTPTWVPVSAIQVALDTSSRGSTLATVTARLRAVSGSVTARLQNVTDDVTAGTSSVVTSTTWVSVSFGVTLTAGARTYELQVLSSIAATDVAAVGYLE